jgi:hypothetical protein
MNLETQIAKLEEIGLGLNAGLTIKDLLEQFDREQYEEDPFGPLLCIYGTETDSVSGVETHCRQVWYFDTECIEDHGAYIAIAEHLCALTGRPDALTNIKDHVDIEAARAWLEYTVGSARRHWDAVVNDDWVDAKVLARIMEDLEAEGRRFYQIDSGQAAVMLYLDTPTAVKLNELIGGTAKPALMSPTNAAREPGPGRW